MSGKSNRPPQMRKFDQLFDECQRIAEDELLPTVEEGLTAATKITARMCLMWREAKFRPAVHHQFLSDVLGKRGSREITRLVNYTIDNIRSKRTQEIVQTYQNAATATIEMLSLEGEGWPPISDPTATNEPSLTQIHDHIDQHGGITSFQQPWMRKIQILKDRERRDVEREQEAGRKKFALDRAKALGIVGETEDEILGLLKEHVERERLAKEAADRQARWDKYLSGGRDISIASESVSEGSDGKDHKRKRHASGEGYGYGGEGPSRAEDDTIAEDNDSIAEEPVAATLPPIKGGMIVEDQGRWVLLSRESAKEVRALMLGD